MSNSFLEFLASFKPSSLSGSLLLFISLPLIYMVSLVIYNIYFHPLSSFPGPLLARASSLWWIKHSIQGDLSRQILALHERYGEIVRVAPRELDTINPEGWKKIYGFGNKQQENPKDPGENFEIDKAHESLLLADRQKHGYLRKLLSNAFSDKTMRTQEHILQQYIDKLIERLRESSENGKPLNIVEWYNFTTFDVIGHLAFNESFDCLKESSYHPWVKMIFASMKYISYMRAIKRIPTFWTILINLIPKSLSTKKQHSQQMILEKVIRRKTHNPKYTDFLTHLILAEEKGQLEFADLLANAELLVIAGSETTATLLSGVTYYILSKRDVLRKLVEEVRSSFGSVDDITVAKVGGLGYMLACLDEAFRIYPPAATAHPRVIAEPGVDIGGYFIPAGMSIGISQYAAFRTSLNWSHPEEFIPERWLEQRNTIFVNDKRDVLQPFSYGPRNCIGRNLAYIEMRLILAKLLWNFDLEATDECVGWADQLIFTTWEKKPLWVRLRSREF